QPHARDPPRHCGNRPGFARARLWPPASRLAAPAAAAAVCGRGLIGVPALPPASRGIASCRRKPDLIRAPIRRHTVVVVNLDFAAAVAPVEVLVGGKRRRALQFLLGKIEMVGAERAIVS